MDLFTPEFKRLKAKNPPPSYDDVIDLLQLDFLEKLKPPKDSKFGNSENIHKLCIKTPFEEQIVGLKPCDEWNVFKFDNFPGFTVIQNPFADGYQRYWVSRCLQDFPSDEKNVTNLSALGDFDSFNLWENFVKQKKSQLEKDDPLRKLRWTTLGYHYNWTTKEYYEEHKADFPEDVQCLTQYFSHCLELGPYQAEAAIVNYYHLDSTLAGHTDHSELDHFAPLFSISFGQTAIFMLGGLTKADKPMSLFLRSGDVCVMSGPCRLAYHAVPKILSPIGGSSDLSCLCLKETQLKGMNKDSSDNCNASPISTESLSSEQNQERRNVENIISHLASNVEEAAKDDPLEPLKSASEQPQDTTCAAEVHLPSIATLNRNITHRLRNLDWNPFNDYLKFSRINLNVRQVFPIGGKSAWLGSICSSAKN